VDAAVAAALTLGVVDGCNSGIGGGCLIMIRTPTGEFAVIDGRETAPAKSSRDMYVRAGKADTEASQTGPLASGTPGALAAYDDAVRSFGRLALRELLLPAAKIAEEGFVVTRDYSTSLEDSAKELAKFPGSVNVLLKDGNLLQQGDVLRQIDLAGTYRSIAEHGTDWFYRGPFAHRVAEWMRANGGILDEADFAAYRSVRREPIVSRYRDLTLVGFPPSSAGGTHVAEILNILEQFDLRRLHEEDPADCAHVIAESMKLAFADRAHWLGDADFAAVPRGLVDPAYAASLAKRIDRRRATQVQGHGMPPAALENLFRKHTTHIAAVDADGFWVGITATVNTSFGSKKSFRPWHAAGRSGRVAPVSSSVVTGPDCHRKVRRCGTQPQTAGSGALAAKQEANRSNSGDWAGRRRQESVGGLRSESPGCCRRLVNRPGPNQVEKTESLMQVLALPSERFGQVGMRRG
jgi:gamma-glutamyltranspeptidase/glutathione hydrolase